MDWKCRLLADCGYEIVWISGQYCRAQFHDHDVMLRWDGERWNLM